MKKAKKERQSPWSTSIGGELYSALVLKVEESHADGRPHILSALYDRQTTHVDGGEQFFIVYAPKCMIEKKGVPS